MTVMTNKEIIEDVKKIFDAALAAGLFKDVQNAERLIVLYREIEIRLNNSTDEGE